MGFALTILYFFTTYLGAETVSGPLVAYHVELIIAVVLILISLPFLPRAKILKTPQSLALIGLSVAVFISIFITGWVGGAVKAFQDFIPNEFAYFLICVHCNSRRKLQIIILLLMFVCLFVIVRGSMELASHPSGSTVTSYLYEHSDEAGHPLYRLRGQGFINDPNDFAQLIVCLIPLVFIFWKQKSRAWNIFLVILPVCALVYGAYLTHSRGFLMAFLAMAVMVGRRRVGIVLSLLGAGALFLGASWLNFTGGRDVSVVAGSGRMRLWAGGLGLLKSHPLFGVGFGRLPEYIGLTAHNSIVLCAAELGLFGLFFWSLFLFPTVRDAFALASPDQVSEAAPVVPEETLNPSPTVPVEGFDKVETNRMGQLLLLSLTGFLVAGFFLSRAFVLTFFLLGGITEVVFELALQRRMIAPRLRLDRVLLYAGVLSIALLLFVYMILRIALS
jgi:hypothetical protein